MAAGGFKTFTTGEVLTAADTNNFLMQGVLVFDDATARDAAITAPVEGQFAYLKDTNVTTYYTGSAWANLDTTGMTNPMTTTADMIYSSSGSTPARLGIGTAGQVLQVNAGATAPEWAAPAGGGKVLQVVSATTTTPMTTTGTVLTDTNLTATITPSAATSKILVLTQQYIATSRSSAYFGTVEGALLRGATLIVDYSTGAGTNYIFFEVQSATSGALVLVQNYSYLDSPATTSATTYKTQLCVDAATASASVTAQQNNNMSSIILMEIGA